MNQGMVRAALLVLLTIILTGSVGAASVQTVTKSADNRNQLMPASPANNTTLLTKDELYSTVVDQERDATTVSLYFVAENGSWYYADPDGTIGALAPNGAEIPNTENEFAEVPPSDRPTYVWKLSKTDCGTTLYNASDGETIATYPIPGCDIPSPSDEETGITDNEAVTADAPGFGVPVAVAALVTVAILLVRR